jgi:AraC-like DNA-binding protein
MTKAGTKHDDYFEPDDVPRPVVAVGKYLLSGDFELAPHQHRKAQLIYMARGVLTCEISRGLWIVAPGSALWIPGNEVHSIKGMGPLETYCLFVDEAASAAGLPEICCTLSVSSLLREIILRCAAFPTLYPLEGSEARVFSVLLDELAGASVEKMHLPMPMNDGLRKIADTMINNPAERFSIDDWAKKIGMSERSLSRLALKETGMSFGRWRQQLHISLALQWLSQGISVQKVASDLGYEGTSSFVLMFRRTLGWSPAKYMAHRKAGVIRFQ